MVYLLLSGPLQKVNSRNQQSKLADPIFEARRLQPAQVIEHLRQSSTLCR
jgi:hypothetical protein